VKGVSTALDILVQVPNKPPPSLKKGAQNPNELCSAASVDTLLRVPVAEEDFPGAKAALC